VDRGILAVNAMKEKENQEVKEKENQEVKEKENQEVKNEKSNEKSKEKKSKISKVDKEVYWIVGFMIGLLILFFAVSAIFKQLKNFDYEGLTFTKEKYGEIPFYQYYYTFTDANGVPKSHIMNLRLDPRVNNISLEGEIVFKRNSQVFVSIDDTNLLQCEQSRPAVANLASFFQGNGIKIISAVPNKERAEEHNVSYANCENRPNNIVVQIQKGEETKITKNRSCHLIEVANCEITPALEKFMVEALAQARSRGSFYSTPEPRIVPL
jgi:hypothetical protein